MGFYAPAQIVRDAQEHGVEVRPVCVNLSRWDCTLEPTADEGRFAVRLGLRMVRGLANVHAAKLVAARGEGRFPSIADLWHVAGVPVASLAQLAKADAFKPDLNLARREALWAIRGLRDVPLPLFAAAAEREGQAVPELQEPEVSLRPMKAGKEVVEDYRSVGLSLRRHPLAFLRERFRAENIRSCRETMAARDGTWLSMAGLVLVRQMPGSPKGVIFATLEDEIGVANIIVWPQIFEKFRRIVLGSSLLGIYGRVQREGEVTHLIAHRLVDMTSELRSVSDSDEAFALPAGRGDEARHGSSDDARALPPKGLRTWDLYTPDLRIDVLRAKGRNFR